MLKQCPQCLKTIPLKNKFCSKSCAASYNNKGRPRSLESRLKTANTLTGTTKYSLSEWNWKEIQEYYDSGYSTRDCYKQFKFSFHIEKMAKEQGLFKTRPPAIFNTSLLTENSSAQRKIVKKHLIQNKIVPHACDNCGQEPFWDNKPLVLILDHKNGINNDNRIENLRLLCPNCNSQTETFCKGQNKNRKSPVKTKQLVEAIRNTKTIKAALASLGMEPSGNNYARITRLAG